MAEKSADDVKSLEMRIAAIEDKLSKLNITEEEMKAYEKVSSIMGAGIPAAGVPMASPQLSPQVCTISRVRSIAVFCFRSPGPVNECTCGPCTCSPQAVSGFGGLSGGFGGLGM